MNKKELEKMLKCYRILAIIFIVGFVGMLAVSVYSEIVHEREVEMKVQDGMNQAELSCVTFLCEKAGCSNINHITEVQNYCKGLVYGTDFYWNLK